MNKEQARILLWGALGFLTPQIIIWLIFALYLIITGRT